MLGRVDEETYARAVLAKDARFDGWFYAAVTTTGIYCRPSCPAQPPKVENLRFYPSAAAAQQAGFRACRRCRPDASPGSPHWNERADLVARAMRLIADGVVDRDGIPGLAAQLGYSVRQVQRQLQAELGAGPLAIARAQRAQTARLLIETTEVPLGDVAFAAGFASVRTFNDTVREVFALTPSDLRVRARRHQQSAAPGTLSLRLPFRQPLSADNLFSQLDVLPGVEEWRDDTYRRTLDLPHGHGIVALRPHPDHIDCRLTLADLRDLATAITRCRWLLDLDADPVAVDELLRADPVLQPLVDKDPGRRVARTVCPDEFAVRTVVGSGELVAQGTPVPDPVGGLTHVFPSAITLAALDIGGELVRALADRSLDLGVGSDWVRVRAQLAAMPGISALPVETIAKRALGDPDAFSADDPVVQRFGLAQQASAWRPWRAYATEYLRG
ncbi:helix-turn-helix domain-containing protein [Kibdelosporangium philippinense]|uniref:Helix-turn-helix domain-containing protein n=1 Tax=Kibdelosporangium philippinense TaxID=211113 RepID=A0ABS8Z8M9_9PSEU|nr:DNA-3-methyladenine glycosylase 2 family protein [Kibdelosporangium philippinense]MCE7004229.1 helix-turn-helix domain-containing protein [Kibdelosporangium philippinense]